VINQKRQIIFVDDDVYVLKGYQRALEPYANEWDVYFCTTGQEALTILSRQPIDAIITDLRMPGMNGIELLVQVIQHFPSVIRMIMSGNVEEPTAYQAASLAHQLMAKPCDIQTIFGAVEDTCHLRDALSDKRLVKIITGLKSLPSVPALYVRLIKEFEREQPTLAKVGEIISMDIAMTAKILQLVNSAFFSIPYKVSNLNQALSILGLNTIKSLVLSVGVFSEYQSRPSSAFSIDELWQHSIFVGNLSRAIAVSANLSRAEQDEAQMAGILHDVGKLIQTDIPGFYRLLSMNTKIPEIQMEYHYLGTSHAEIGAYMLSLWGLPSTVIKAVAFHHKPIAETAFKMDAVFCVYIANHLYYEEKPNNKSTLTLPPMDMQLLEQIKAAPMLSDWHYMAKRIFAGEKPD
jgi:putative nucleotidyltransferase with HDIG domain